MIKEKPKINNRGYSWSTRNDIYETIPAKSKICNFKVLLLTNRNLTVSITSKLLEIYGVIYSNLFESD